MNDVMFLAPSIARCAEWRLSFASSFVALGSLWCVCRSVALGADSVCGSHGSRDRVGRGSRNLGASPV